MVFNEFSVKVSLNDVSTLLKAFKILRYQKQGQCESHFVYGIKYKIKYTQQMGQYRLRDNAGAGGERNHFRCVNHMSARPSVHTSTNEFAKSVQIATRLGITEFAYYFKLS